MRYRDRHNSLGQSYDDGIERIVGRVAHREAILDKRKRSVELISAWIARMYYLQPFAVRREHERHRLQFECAGVAEVGIAGIGPRKATLVGCQWKRRRR